jgi:hypothetical protein
MWQNNEKDEIKTESHEGKTVQMRRVEECSQYDQNTGHPEWTICQCCLPGFGTLRCGSSQIVLRKDGSLEQSDTVLQVGLCEQQMHPRRWAMVDHYYRMNVHFGRVIAVIEFFNKGFQETLFQISDDYDVSIPKVVPVNCAGGEGGSLCE